MRRPGPRREKLWQFGLSKAVSRDYVLSPQTNLYARDLVPGLSVHLSRRVVPSESLPWIVPLHLRLRKSHPPRISGGRWTQRGRSNVSAPGFADSTRELWK